MDEELTPRQLARQCMDVMNGNREKALDMFCEQVQANPKCFREFIAECIRHSGFNLIAEAGRRANNEHWKLQAMTKPQTTTTAEACAAVRVREGARIVSMLRDHTILGGAVKLGKATLQECTKERDYQRTMVTSCTVRYRFMDAIIARLRNTKAERVEQCCSDSWLSKLMGTLTATANEVKTA